MWVFLRVRGEKVALEAHGVDVRRGGYVVDDGREQALESTRERFHLAPAVRFEPLEVRRLTHVYGFIVLEESSTELGVETHAGDHPGDELGS